MRRAFVATVAMVLGLMCCEDRQTHPFGAYEFDPSLDCLEDPRAVDVLAGPAGDPCDVVKCWVSPSNVAFVTDQACDAPPDYHDGTDDPVKSLCGLALAAWKKGADGRCPAGTGMGGGTTSTNLY